MGRRLVKDFDVGISGSVSAQSFVSGARPGPRWRTSRCPFLAGLAHVSLSQGHPRERPLEDFEVPILGSTRARYFFQGRPWARAYCSTARCPRSAE